jgi:hypothetical protein
MYYGDGSLLLFRYACISATIHKPTTSWWTFGFMCPIARGLENKFGLVYICIIP